MIRSIAGLALAAQCALAFAADVEIDAQQRETLGIETVAPVAVDAPRMIQATALVLDPSPLIALMGELHAAQLAAASSTSELARLTRLHEEDANASLKSVEAARAQAAADSGHAAALRAQLAATWSRSLASLDNVARSRLLDDLASGRAALLRAEIAEIVSPQLDLRDAQVHALDGDETWVASVLGRAAQGTERGIGVAFLLRVSADLSPNRVLRAELIDRNHPIHGVKIPRAALVRWQGSDWVFVEREANTFTRALVHPVEWLDDGCLVKESFAPEQKIVATGAMLLLGMEGAGAEKKEEKED